VVAVWYSLHCLVSLFMGDGAEAANELFQGLLAAFVTPRVYTYMSIYAT